MASKTIDLADDDLAVEDADITSQRTAETETMEFRNLADRIIKMGLCPVGKVRGLVKRDLRNLAGQIKQIIEIGGVKYSEVGPVDPRFPNTLLQL